MLFYYPPSSQADTAAALWWSEPETLVRWYSTSSDCDITRPDTASAAAAASQRNFKPPLTHGHTCTRGMLTAGTSCARNLPLLQAPLRNSKRSKHIQTVHTCTARGDGRRWMSLPRGGVGCQCQVWLKDKKQNNKDDAKQQIVKLLEKREGRSSALTQIG